MNPDLSTNCTSSSTLLHSDHPSSSLVLHCVDQAFSHLKAFTLAAHPAWTFFFQKSTQIITPANFTSLFKCHLSGLPSLPALEPCSSTCHLSYSYTHLPQFISYSNILYKVLLTIFHVSFSPLECKIQEGKYFSFSLALLKVSPLDCKEIKQIQS